MKCIVCQRSETTENGSPNEVCLPPESSGNEIWRRSPKKTRSPIVNSFLFPPFFLPLFCSLHFEICPSRANTRVNFVPFSLPSFLPSFSFSWKKESRLFLSFILSVNSNRLKQTFVRRASYYATLIFTAKNQEVETLILHRQLQ